MNLTPKQRRAIHATTATLFFRTKKEATYVWKEELASLNPDAKHVIIKALGGENKGKWILHITNEGGVRFG